MAAIFASASRDPVASGSDPDAAVVAEAVSKRYAGVPVPLYPPMVSIFHRDLFRRKSRTEDGGKGVVKDDENNSPQDSKKRKSSIEDRRRRSSSYEDPDDEDDEDDDDELDDEEGPPSTMRLEPFWALKDVSFRVPRGGSLGVLGERDSGKSTLLRILAGETPPTEGRVLIRSPVSPPPDELAKGLAYTGRGTFRFNLVLGCRMLGISPHLVKKHRDEIEELAPLELRPDGSPDPGAIARMAAATAVVVPSSVILLEDGRGWDEPFTERIIELARERLRSGSALILASRNPELVREVCDEAILLREGAIVDRGRAKGVTRRSGAQGSRDKKASGDRASTGPAPSTHHSQGRKVRVPSLIPAFNASAALLSATLSTAAGRPKRIDAAAEVTVEICLETAVPDVEVHCGVGFTPRGGDQAGIRVDLPEPLRLVEPRSYMVVARVAPGALRTGAYQVRADAIVAHPDERAASVIARDIGRVRVEGDEIDAAEPAEPPVAHWDGRLAWRAEAEWSIE